MGWSIHITCSTSVSLEPIMQPTLVVMWFASTVEPVMIKATCLKQPLINFTYIQTSIQRPPSTNRPQFFGPWVATLDRSHCTCASSPQGSSVAGRCRAEAHAQVRSDDTAWTGSCWVHHGWCDMWQRPWVCGGPPAQHELEIKEESKNELLK